MRAEIHGKPVFAHIRVDLDPGESLTAESGAMSSMSAELDLDSKLNGGLFSGVARKVFGGESLFINHFTNKTQKPLQLILTQATPGDIREIDLNGQSLCLQPGAYIA